MLATAHWKTTFGKEFDSLVERGNKSYFNKYDPVLASTQLKRDEAKSNGNTKEGDGYKYRSRGLVHLT